MYEGASRPATGGDARLLGLEVVCVSSAATVREQQAPFSVLESEYVKALYHHFTKATSTKCEKEQNMTAVQCCVTKVDEDADLVKVEPGNVARAYALVLHQAALVCNRCHIYGVKMKFRCCEHRL